MEWDGIEKYVPWTTLSILLLITVVRKKEAPSPSLSLCPPQHRCFTNYKTVLSLLPKHDLQYLKYWLFLLLKQFLNGCDL